ncbi:MAG: LPS export ABC transporter periplasmic protein LptC, partial [Muribaculaceae bacterium]|nr:LPS export ABC transporter periplasmic protein LptC [Muribaculaceae bacterium]
ESGPDADQTPDSGADRHEPNRVFLEQADLLKVDPDEPNVQILVGSVTFRRGDMFMYCDSARFYTDPSQPSDSMEAFGNIRLEQGDTLFLYGDEMEYSGYDHIATVYGIDHDVRLINRDVTLTSPVIHYDMEINLGYYDQGGTLTDPQNTLSSLEGEYAPPTKEANFYGRVRLTGVNDNGDTVNVRTDTLLYNTNTRIAELPVFSRIIGKKGDIITTNGFFNTSQNTATLLDRSMVHTTDGNTLTGDSIVYDRTTGIGEAFGSMVITDSARQVRLEGDYGYFNQQIDSAYATGNARALEYSKPDTLYLHGREIRTYQSPDSQRLMVANPEVRFWRVDIQGVCDSMTFVQEDSTLYMNGDPILWNDNRQIFGNIIKVHLNDSTVDRAELPDFAFVAEAVEDEFYNQMSGKSMIADFDNGDLTRLQLNGSVQAIMLPEENDSTFNKMVSIESSYLDAYFKDRDIERARMWPETTGTVTPLYLARRSMLYLPKFRWETELRPSGPDDIFPRTNQVTPIISTEEDDEETTETD